MTVEVITQYRVNSNYFSTPQGALSAVENLLAYWRRELSVLLQASIDTSGDINALESSRGAMIVDNISEFQADKATLLGIIEGTIK